MKALKSLSSAGKRLVPGRTSGRHYQPDSVPPLPQRSWIQDPSTVFCSSSQASALSRHNIKDGVWLGRNTRALQFEAGASVPPEAVQCLPPPAYSTFKRSQPVKPSVIFRLASRSAHLKAREPRVSSSRPPLKFQAQGVNSHLPPLSHFTSRTPAPNLRRGFCGPNRLGYCPLG